MIIAAQRSGVKKVIVPIENVKEAKLVQNVEIIGLGNLRDVIRLLEGTIVEQNYRTEEKQLSLQPRAATIC